MLNDPILSGLDQAEPKPSPIGVRHDERIVACPRAVAGTDVAVTIASAWRAMRVHQSKPGAGEITLQQHTDAEMAVGAGAIFLANGEKIENTFYMVGTIPPRPWERMKFVADETKNIVVSYNSGWRNYYHWTMQCVFSTYIFLRSGLENPAFVFPSSVNEPYKRLLSLIGCDDSMLISMHKNASVALKRVWISNATYENQVWNPSPLIADFAAAIAERADKRAAATPARIYISRRDTDRRVMENEAKVEAMLAGLGFAIVQLKGMPIDEQVWLFRNARIVVGAHGAGLTNILYCRPGTRIHELTSSSVINPCFSRMSQVLSLHHHVHVFDPARGDGPSATYQTWRADADYLRELLE